MRFNVIQKVGLESLRKNDLTEHELNVLLTTMEDKKSLIITRVHDTRQTSI